MKTKGNPKKNLPIENDRFDRKSAKSTHKDRSSKRKLSIYDEFEEDGWDDFGYNANDLDDDLTDDD